jgi:hypothetical protein
MLSFFNDADGYTAVSGFTRGPNGEVLPPEASGQVHVLDRIRFAGRQVRAHDLMIVLNDVGFTLQARRPFFRSQDLMYRSLSRVIEMVMSEVFTTVSYRTRAHFEFSRPPTGKELCLSF